ncbi:hypothetical protein F53441_10882 [Fusarium austroafricanum]|uniref:Ankyrin repeat protein n=1 Tax=Fusarium austroafricanum TaxID=2364996 RepID=A0A8H4K9P7_9HYPO|nr:hypothetical protein F53441_10882 [Fusarium austroafricanum]
MHDLESFDLSGRTRLHQVCMAEAILTSKKKAVAMLITAGADLTARVAKSWSPDDHQTLGFTCLHSLVYKAHQTKSRDELEALILLIKQGADIFAVDHHQHTVSMRAYLPNSNDNQYSSKGSYRGDLWDAALAICGYDIQRHRNSYPRVPRYNKSYRRIDFERLWEGYEAACPYWNDERYPETGGVDDFWKQPIRRCDHIACSDCEEHPADMNAAGEEPRKDADVPAYAQAAYREWIVPTAASDPDLIAYIDCYPPETPDWEEEYAEYCERIKDEVNRRWSRSRSRESDSDGGVELCEEMEQETNGLSPPTSEDGEAAYDEMENRETSDLSPPTSEDGDTAYERLVLAYEDQMLDYNAWHEHIIREAEEETTN